MDIFNKIKKAMGDGAQEEASKTPALPSLDEINNRIIKAKLSFRQTISEAEAAFQKSQALYAKIWDAAPVLREKMRKEKNELDAMVKRKMVQAQGFAKSMSVLQDVQIVMEIDKAFSECGLVDANAEQSRSLVDIQKSLEEASFVVTRTMQDIEKLGLSIAMPDGHTAAQTSEKDRELDELWAKFDQETDPAKKEEIKRKLQEKEAPPQVAMI